MKFISTSVSCIGLTPVLLERIKEQQRQIDELKMELKNLKAGKAN